MPRVPSRRDLRGAPPGSGLHFRGCPIIRGGAARGDSCTPYFFVLASYKMGFWKSFIYETVIDSDYFSADMDRCPC